MAMAASVVELSLEPVVAAEPELTLEPVVAAELVVSAMVEAWVSAGGWVDSG
ncbi:hypothetical protein E4U61_000301, partial [Claviceps capensis]